MRVNRDNKEKSKDEKIKKKKRKDEKELLVKRKTGKEIAMAQFGRWDHHPV